MVNFLRVWNVAEDDQPCEHIEPVQEDHSELRAKALEAMRSLNEENEFYVVDVTHEESLPDDLKFAGGTFRVFTVDRPREKGVLWSAEHLVSKVIER